MFQQTSLRTAGDALIQVAIQMESTGKDFYEVISVSTGDAKVRNICMKLAVAELRHGEVFQRMRSELADQNRTVLLSDQELAEARKATKEAILPSPSAIHEMVSGGDIRTLFDLAIQMERDAIQFYRSFRSSMLVQDHKNLDAIIHEEEQHLRLLTAFLSQ